MSGLLDSIAKRNKAMEDMINGTGQYASKKKKAPAKKKPVEKVKEKPAEKPAKSKYDDYVPAHIRARREAAAKGLAGSGK